MKTVRVQRKYGQRTAVCKQRKQNTAQVSSKRAPGGRGAERAQNGNPPQTGTRSLTARMSGIPGVILYPCGRTARGGTHGPEKHPTVRAKSALAPPSSTDEAGTLGRCKPYPAGGPARAGSPREPCGRTSGHESWAKPYNHARPEKRNSTRGPGDGTHGPPAVHLKTRPHILAGFGYTSATLRWSS